MYQFKSKCLYIEDIHRLAYELLDECTTIQKLPDADAQRLNSIMTGVKLMADRVIDEIEKEEDK